MMAMNIHAETEPGPPVIAGSADKAVTAESLSTVTQGQSTAETGA
jgi:hypothetical protein